jgi:hypothetical protein
MNVKDRLDAPVASSPGVKTKVSEALRSAIFLKTQEFFTNE